MVKIELTEPGYVENVGRRFKREARVGQVYTVKLDDGTVAGTVSYEMQTFERGARGRTYVTSRWRSPRWFFRVAGSFKRSFEYTSRKQAVEALVRAFGLSQSTT